MRQLGRYLVTFISIVYAMSIVSPLVRGEWPPGVELLIEKNEVQIGRVYAAEMQIESSYQIRDGQKEVSPIRKTIWAFDRRNSRERRRTWNLNLPQSEGGVPINCFDYLVTNSSARSLVNWDWKRSKPILPSQQGYVRAYTGSPGTLLKGPVCKPTLDMLYELASNGEDLWPLRKFVTDARDVQHMPGTLIIDMRHPDFEKEGPNKGGRCRIEFSDNGLVKSFASEWYSKQAKADLLEWSDIEEFRELENGIWLPSKTITGIKRKDGSLVFEQVLMTFSNQTINQQVPASAFDFRIPENALVVDLDIDPRGTQEEYDLYLWGDNDKEKAKLSSIHELSGYDNKTHVPKSYIVAVIVGVLLVVSGAVAYISRRRSR